MNNNNKSRIVNLLDKIIKEGYSPNEDEIKQLRVISDDMEDNGMSRYMENNDEEGWD